MNDSHTEPPRFVLVLGTLFLLAYAAYHLGAAWMDSVSLADTGSRRAEATPTPTRTLIPSPTAPAKRAATAYPQPILTLPASPPPEEGLPSPTPSPASYPGPSPTNSPPAAGATPNPAPTRTLLPTATAAQTDNPYPGPSPTNPLPAASATGEPYPGVTATASAPPTLTPTPAPTATSGVQPTATRSAPPPTNTPAPGSPTPAPTYQPQPTVTALPYEEIVIISAGAIHQVVRSSDGRQLAFAADNGAYIYNAATRQNQRVLNAGDTLLSLRFAAENRVLVTGGAGGQIRWWETATGAYLGARTAHALGVTGLDLPGAGSPLVSSGDDAVLRVWEVSRVVNQGVDSVQLLHTLRGPVTRIADLDVSPNGQMVAAASQGRVHVWNPQNGSLLKTFQLPHWYTALAFSPSGQRLATAYNGQRLTVWDTATWGLAQFIPLSGPVRDLAYSPDGARIAVGYEDGRIQIWEAGSGMLRAELSGHDGLRSLIFIAGGNTLVTTSAHGSVRFWDLSPLN